ncbi:hypothetical protein PFISCL1PPCAC_22103, partial [Pristionchus fissidentatus]
RLQWLRAADAAPLLRSCASWWLPCAQHQQQHTTALSLCAHDVAASSCVPPAHQPDTSTSTRRTANSSRTRLTSSRRLAPKE